jgi:hypothetical protein
MYARVTVTTDERKEALVVPTNAVVDTGGRRGVFLAADNNTVAFRPVTVGIEEDSQTEILDGLSDGDRVVTTGAAGLRDGDRVVLAGEAAGGRGGDGPDGTVHATDGPSDAPAAGAARGDGAGRQGGARGGGRGGLREQQSTP